MVGTVPTKINLDIYQGDDLYMTVKVTDPNTGDPADLTGCTARSQIRATADSTTVLASFTITLGSNGEIYARLPAATTAALTPGSAVWDFELTDPAGTGHVMTLCAGAAVISPEVTR